MNLTVRLVDIPQIPMVEAGLTEYLNKSEAWTQGRALSEDIVSFVKNGWMYLWVVLDKDTLEIYGYVISEIYAYPRTKALRIQYCAGVPHCMEHVEDEMFDTLERFAEDAGCTIVEWFGRPGWRTTAKKHGYGTQEVIFEKYL